MTWRDERGVQQRRVDAGDEHDLGAVAERLQAGRDPLQRAARRRARRRRARARRQRGQRLAGRAARRRPGPSTAARDEADGAAQRASSRATRAAPSARPMRVDRPPARTIAAVVGSLTRRGRARTPRSAASPNSQKRASSTSGCVLERGARGGDRGRRGLVERVAVDAGRDRRERDARAAVLGGELDRAAVAGGQQLALAASPPCQTGPTAWMTWSTGRRPAPVIFASPVSQPPSARHSSSSSGPGGAVDRAVDPAAAEQALVGGVDDRVGLGVGRDVAAMQRDDSHDRQCCACEHGGVSFVPRRAPRTVFGGAVAGLLVRRARAARRLGQPAAGALHRSAVGGGRREVQAAREDAGEGEGEGPQEAARARARADRRAGRLATLTVSGNQILRNGKPLSLPRRQPRLARMGPGELRRLRRRRPLHRPRLRPHQVVGRDRRAPAAGAGRLAGPDLPGRRVRGRGRRRDREDQRARDVRDRRPALVRRPGPQPLPGGLPHRPAADARRRQPRVLASGRAALRRQPGGHLRPVQRAARRVVGLLARRRLRRLAGRR